MVGASTPRRSRLQQKTKALLRQIDQKDHAAYLEWLASIRKAKRSQQTDLPSSQIIPKTSLIKAETAQLFAVIDTCSLIAFQASFIDYVTQQKKLFQNSCPVKIIISLTVLEELDRCNRRKKKAKSGEQVVIKSENQTPPSLHKTTSDHELADLIEATNKANEPPRLFMRFIEEEMRTSDILIGDLDPQKRLSLDRSEQAFEIVNKDDRILDSCLRARSFIAKHSRHPETKVILISEDNIFKSKATTYEIVSYRWNEFTTKYKNYGLHHYTCSPVKPASLQATACASSVAQAQEEGIEFVKEVINLE